MVDGLEQEVSGFAQVVRLNLQDEVGQVVGARYGVRLVPTYLVLDRQGEEMDRLQGMPHRERLLAALRRVANG